MKAAFAVWNNRIAPVFDVARQVHVVVMESGQIVSEAEEELPDDIGHGKGLRLAELGVDTLVCGAISRSMQAIVSAYGIRTIPFVAGGLRRVIRAWSCGALEKGTFAMPGCCIRDRRQPGRVRAMKEEALPMGGQGTGERGPGGQGQGQGGSGQGAGGGGRGRGGQAGGRRGRAGGRMGGPKAAGPAGACVCAKCGHREPHARGIPCSHMQCPKCGGIMTRE
jgi:predicted Fe-Mo cluster-binding NifX family protein